MSTKSCHDLTASFVFPSMLSNGPNTMANFFSPMHHIYKVSNI